MKKRKGCRDCRMPMKTTPFLYPLPPPTRSSGKQREEESGNARPERSPPRAVPIRKTQKTERLFRKFEAFLGNSKPFSACEKRVGPDWASPRVLPSPPSISCSCFSCCCPIILSDGGERVEGRKTENYNHITFFTALYFICGTEVPSFLECACFNLVQR